MTRPWAPPFSGSPTRRSHPAYDTSNHRRLRESRSTDCAPTCPATVAMSTKTPNLFPRTVEFRGRLEAAMRGLKGWPTI